MAGDACRRHGAVPRAFCEGCRATKAANQIRRLTSQRDALLGALRECVERLDRVLSGADLENCMLCERCWEDTTKARDRARAAIEAAGVGSSRAIERAEGGGDRG